MLTKQQQRKAFRQILTSQTLVKLADQIMNAKVTLPWLLQALGAPASFVTWLVPIRESGSLIPQLFISGSVQKLQFRKYAWILGSMTQALALLAIGLTVWFGDGYTAGLGILLFLGAFSIAKSLSSLSSKDVMAKTTSKRWRGKLGGFSDSLSGLVVISVAVVLMFWPRSSATAQDYAIAFWVAAILISLAVISYGFIAEPPSNKHSAQRVPFCQRLSHCFASQAFRRFLLTRSLLLSSSLSAPFFIVLSHNQDQNSLLSLGGFLLANAVATVIAGPFWGHFSDLSSRRVMIGGALLTTAIGMATFIVAKLFNPWLNSLWLLPLLYLGLTIAHQGVRLGRQTYIVNMAEGNTRTDYVAISNTVIGVIMLVLGSAGLLLNYVSAEAMILLFSLPALAGALMALLLPETEIKA